MVILVDLEGLDGVGKTTQAIRLHQHYTKQGVHSVYQHFPQLDSKAGRKIRDYLQGRLSLTALDASHLFTFDRQEFFSANPSFLDAEICICDRYINSNILHQMCQLEQSEWPSYIADNYAWEFEELHIPKPDVTICLRAKPVTVQASWEARKCDPDVIESDLNRTKRTIRVMDWAAIHLGWKIVDCDAPSGGLLSKDIITHKLIECLDEHLSRNQ